MGRRTRMPVSSGLSQKHGHLSTAAHATHPHAGNACRSIALLPAVHSRAMRLIALFLATLLAGSSLAAPPATRPAEGKLPHLRVDRARQQVRVECEAINAEEKLEFLVCAT